MQKNAVTELFMDTRNVRELLNEALATLLDLQQVAYDAKFKYIIYSYYHEVYYTIELPIIDVGHGGYYNSTKFENSTITDINNLLVDLTQKLISAEDAQLLETFTSYGFMLIYRNQETFTNAYAGFCRTFMNSAENDALDMNNVFTIYTAVTLSIFFLFSIFYLVFERHDLTILKKQVDVLHNNVSKNEIGKIYHTLSKKVGDEVTIHISKSAILKPQNFFIIVTALLTGK